VIIRPFATANDAQAIVDLDAATFDDCPYTAEYILRLQADPGEHAWLAQEGNTVVGFVSAFATRSLAADRWEIDELAVHPAAQGRGVGTALVTHAVHQGRQNTDLAQARALVEVNNRASQRVFEKAGLAPVAEVHLLLYRVSGRVPRPRRPHLPAVRVAGPADGPAIALLAGCDPFRALGCLRQPDNVYLVAGDSGRAEDSVRAEHSARTVSGARPYGYIELVHVRTLQYEGYWVESLAVDARRLDADRRRATLSALLDAAIECTKRQNALDEAGCLVPIAAVDLYEAAVAEGFAPRGRYQILVRELST
jgi:ribosomal protein S18 acetylase RimI-like enzyme